MCSVRETKTEKQTTTTFKTINEEIVKLVRFWHLDVRKTFFLFCLSVEEKH